MFLVVLFSIVNCADGLIEVIENERDGNQYLHVNWSNIQNEANLNWYRVNRSINGQEFQTISTMDLEAGNQVRVLNVYPAVSKTAEFYYPNGTKYTITARSAGLKVYMEGGKVVADGKTVDVEAAGALMVNGQMKQLIDVTPITAAEYNDNPRVVFNYDVAMFGSWDDFARNGGPITNDAVDVLEEYLDKGNGILIGHDGISAILGKSVGFGRLAKRLGIDVGYMSQGPNADRDNLINFEIKTKYVKVSREGRLTTYPHNLGKLGTVMTIPLSHTASQFAHEDVWFEFVSDVDGNRDPIDCVGCTKNPTVGEAMKAGNCVFYLTTKGNLAFIQTGHSNGESSKDERSILANTLFYLKQKSDNTYVNDFDVFDVEPPLKPELVNIRHNYGTNNAVLNGDVKTFIDLKGIDKGTSFVYNIIGYNPIMEEKYTSGNITAIVTAGMQHFKYFLDDKPTCTDFSLLTSKVAATEVKPDSKTLFSTGKIVKTSTTTGTGTKTGVATIEITSKPGQTLYLHVAGVDKKDIVSREIATFAISFPTLPPTENIPPPEENPTKEEGSSNSGGAGSGNDDNNQNTGNGSNKKDNNTTTIVGAVVGVVAAAAAVAGIVAAVTLCKPPIAIVPLFGANEEEEEEEDFYEVPTNVIFGENEQMDPSIVIDSEGDLDPYANEIVAKA